MARSGQVVRLAVFSVATGGLALLALAAKTTGPERVSYGDAGADPDGFANGGAVTGNGRYVAFYTHATNMFPQATTGTQVVVRDRKKGTNDLVSHTAAGAGGNGNSLLPSLSNNGRYVLFESLATDLVPSDASGDWDVFRADRKTGEVRRISEPPGGGDPNSYSLAFGASLSKNGRYAVYASDASNLVDDDGNGFVDVFLYDAVRRTTTLVSRNPAGAPANGPSDSPSISPNGRFVVYRSTATDLVPGKTSGTYDLFVYDARKRTTAKASPAAAGAEADDDCDDPVVSDDGRWVAFDSAATNLVAGDGNGQQDVFLYDRRKDAMRRVSVLPSGTEGNGGSYAPSISANGKVLLFYTGASNFSPDDANGPNADVYRADLKKGGLVLVTRAADGGGANDASYLFPTSLASNGHWLAFPSAATDLVPGGAPPPAQEYVLRVR